MKQDFLRNMLLIEEPSVFILYKEMTDIALLLLFPLFLVGLITEYFTDFQFADIIKKLFFVSLFISFFYQFHTKAVEVSLTSASETLTRISPNNIFQKRWTEGRIKTETKTSWGWAKSFVVPNLNELIGTTLFVLAQVLLWILKLIYSTVYHLTYVFSGITAVMYFMGWTRDALKGTIQASIWCLLQPYVIVALLALVGNSINESMDSDGLVAGSMDGLIWLFGITFLMLASPLMTYGMVKGDGIHSFGSKVGAMTAVGAKKMMMYPVLASHLLSNSYNSMNRGAAAGSRVFKGAQKSFSGIKNSIAHSKKANQTTSSPVTKFLSEKNMAGSPVLNTKTATHQRNASAATKKYLPNRPLHPSEVVSKFASPQALKSTPESSANGQKKRDVTSTASRYLSPEVMSKNVSQAKPSHTTTSVKKSQIRPRRQTHELR